MENYVFNFEVNDGLITVSLNLKFEKDGIQQELSEIVFHQDDIDIVEKDLNVKFDFEKNIMYAKDIKELMDKLLEE